MKRGADGSWEHDRDTSHRTDSHARRRPRLPGRERGGGHHPPRPPGGLRVHRTHPGQVSVPLRPVQDRERRGEEIPRQGDRVLPGPADPPHRAPAPHGRDPGPQATPSGPAFPNRLHARRRRAAGGGGEAFGQLSGPATKEILRRQHEVFGDKRFARLARISNGHIYNLRRRRAYRRARITVRGTRGAPSSIGVRRKPRPQGRPGFVRVDTVHSATVTGRREYS